MGEARTRFVVIGASNAWMALPGVLRCLAPGTDVLVAAGHGRSYGARSRYFWRELPSILECGLWPELARGGASSHALVTDVGNDLAYGSDAKTIAGWVDEILARLEGRVLLTALPLEGLEALSPFVFHAVRILVFRGRPLDQARVLAEARELDARMAELARARGARLVRIPRAAIGWDGIHQRRSARAELWQGWLRELGVELDPAQACARSADGRRVSIF